MGAFKLSVAELVSRAEEEANLGDWGGTSFLGELDLLSHDLCESGPNQYGFDQFVNRVSRTLVNRLKIVQDRKTYSDIPRQKIRAPMIVIGIGRSGTTFMQALLAQDPHARSVAEWEGWRPSPPPKAATYRSDPRIAESQAEIPDDPGWQEKHIHGAELPIECGPAFFNYEFLSMGYDCRWRLPNYRQRMKLPIDEAYNWHNKCLQHFQSQMPQEHWVLKSGEHLSFFDQLFKIYPDVRIVFTHRDPASAFASLGSVVSYMRKSHYDERDPIGEARQAGQEVLDYWGYALNKAHEFRESHPELESHFCDVIYRDLVADPIGEVQRIYQHFGMELTPEREEIMKSWYANYERTKYREKFGSHVYTIEDYGLNREVVNEQLSGYLSKYGLVRSKNLL